MAAESIGSPVDSRSNYYNRWDTLASQVVEDVDAEEKAARAAASEKVRSPICLELKATWQSA
eukprot:2043762-Amphidinium_carterae.1